MFVSLDLETTGFDPKNDKIIEFGAIKFDFEGNQETLQFLVNPDTPIPQIVTHITNINDEDVKDAPRFTEKLQEVKDFIGDLPIVGHNIQFDTNFLKENGIPRVNPEYDTCLLSSILIPGLPSYSLEILASIFNLQHKEAHRALDDAIAAMELFLKATKQFQSLPPNLIAEIKTLVKKSDWDLRTLLISLEHTEETPPVIPEKTLIAPKEPTDFQKLILDTEKSALFEAIPPYEELVATLVQHADKDSYIALDNKLFHKMIDALPSNIAKIDAPNQYISPKRLAEFKNKSHFENDEMAALLKFLIWLPNTETGLLKEVKLFKEEKYLTQKVAIDEKLCNLQEEEFFKKAQEKDATSPAICTHEYLQSSTTPIKDLILINFDQFIHNLFYQESDYLTHEILSANISNLQDAINDHAITENLQNKITMFFGMLGIFFEKYNDKNSYTQRAFVNKALTENQEWLDLKSSISSIIELSSELGNFKTEATQGHLQNWKEVLIKLDQTFRNPNVKEHLTWIEKDPFENLIIRRTPLKTEQALSKILDNCQNYKIVDEAIDLNDDAKFFKENLPNDTFPPLYKQPLAHNLEIYITEDSPESDHKKAELVPFLKDYLIKKGGRTAMIFNSRQQMQYFTLELNKELQEAGLKLASQMTGSLGKITEQFKKDPENTILFITPYLWLDFPQHDQINNLVLHKIPFMPPSDPYITTKSTKYRNAFFEFQIPLAIQSLRKIINRLDTSTEKTKEMIVLDSRLVSKRYGKDIIENLNSITKTETVTMSSLLR